MQKWAVSVPAMASAQSQGACRLAFLVLNDTYRDSRVLRMADSAASEGYQVRVFATNSFDCPASLEVRESGAQILRQAIVPRVVWDAIRFGRHLSREAPKERAKESESPPDNSRRPSWGSRARHLARTRSRDYAALAKLRLRRRFDRITTASVIEWHPDLVHAHDANTLQIALNLSIDHGVPFVYDAHELWEGRGSRVRGGREEENDSLLLNKATAVASGIVTVSPGVADWMTTRYNLHEPPLLVRNIPATVDLSNAPERGLRALAGLRTDTKVVVYVGIVGPNRGLRETVWALAHLDRDCHLVVLGYSNDAYDKTLSEIAESAGVGQRVHFVGSVDPNQVVATIADADVALVIVEPEYLSAELSLPNKLFEAIQGQVPVLASNLPDISALVDKYGVGKIIESTTPDEIASAVDELVGEPRRFREACAAAAEELQWSHEVSRLFELYGRILSQKGPETRDR